MFDEDLSLRQWFLSRDVWTGSSVQWFLSFDREMFGEVVVNGSSRFSYEDSRCRLGFSRHATLVSKFDFSTTYFHANFFILVLYLNCMNCSRFIGIREY
ncbi:hypothetical protein Syun_001387 [Stephania yunnanensis]|uniref:Uncharacterized protein n=1 Tax=Stephania yunnanensis TaxID=152371 RepID=A0AAP0LFI5_9MAGN